MAANHMRGSIMKAGILGGIFMLGWFFSAAVPAAEPYNYVQNGTFSTFVYNNATNPALERYGYIREAADAGSIFDSTTPYYIPGWKYVVGDGGGGFGMNGLTVATANNNNNTFSGSTSLPSDPVVFVQRKGTFSTILENLIVGETYTLAYQYSSRPGRSGTHSGDIQSYLMTTTLDSNVKTILQSNQRVLHNAGGYYDFIYDFVATDTKMEFGFETGYSGTDRTTTFANVSVNLTSDLPSGGFRSPTAWIGDATSGILVGGRYTHAYNFGTNAATVMLNGVAFKGVTNNAAGTGDAASGFTWTNNGGNYGSGNATPVADAANNPGSVAILSSFRTDGPNFTLDGLFPGYEYELTLLTSSYGSANRTAKISVNGGDTKVFNAYGAIGATPGTTEGYLDKEGITVSWRGQADENGRLTVTGETLSVDPSVATWHIYGLANRVVSAPDGILMHTGFFNTGSLNVALVGTRMDHVNVFGENNAWIGRGQRSDGNNVILQPNGIVATGANSGAAMAFNNSVHNAEILSCYESIILSADIQIGSLNANGTDYGAARGLGLGFFDQNGDTTSEVARGFSGVVVAPNGGLYFFSNMTRSTLSNDAVMARIPYGGDFDINSFYNLSLEVVLNDNGTATLIDVIFGDETNTADYSALIGSVFETTQLIGFMSSSNAWGHFGYIDNFQVTGIVPEPATWVMLLLGLAGGVVGYRRRGR